MYVRENFRIRKIKDGTTAGTGQYGGVTVDWSGLKSQPDITERKRNADDLAFIQKRLIEVYHLAHIGTWDWVGTSDIVTWSEEMFHISKRDPTLRAPTSVEYHDIFTPFSWNLLSNAVSITLATGEPFNLELEFILPDGTIRWMNVFGGPIYEKDGKVIGRFMVRCRT